MDSQEFHLSGFSQCMSWRKDWWHQKVARRRKYICCRKLSGRVSQPKKLKPFFTLTYLHLDWVLKKRQSLWKKSFQGDTVAQLLILGSWQRLAIGQNTSRWLHTLVIFGTPKPCSYHVLSVQGDVLTDIYLPPPVTTNINNLRYAKTLLIPCFISTGWCFNWYLSPTPGDYKH